MGGLGVVPPGVARQGHRKAGVLNRIALQPFSNEGKGPALAAKAQGHQLLAGLGSACADA